VEQRLETLQKVCALAFAFSAAHIKHAALHSAQRYTVRSATQCTARSATQRAALHSAQRFAAPSASLRPALHCAQRRTVRNIVQPLPPPPSSAAQRAALHSAQHYTAPSTASQDKAECSNRTKPVAQRGLLRFLCSISAHENRSADTRARSLCLERLGSIFGALGTPGKPNRDVPRNALLCSFLFLFYGTLVRSCAWPSFDFLCRMIT
jgi:hypothetical protein